VTSTKLSEITNALNQETIIAQCTPRASGALALLRLSGPQAVTIASTISKLPRKKQFSEQPTHTIHYGHIVDEYGARIDQVLFFLMRGPQTFTGEDIVEISAHNNQFIISAIIEQAIKSGARMAQEGEFSRRAFLNGKIDLIQAEAINELIHAQTQLGLKASLAQLEGSLSHEINAIENDLMHALVFSQASFEFIEEEGAEFDKEITHIITQVTEKIATLKKNFDHRKLIKEGVRIALIGSVNTGKSSLFNKLVGQDRAIVTAIPGTTRDVIEAGVYNHDTYQTFVDTAGLRITHDSIEQEGIRRSHIEAQKADIILLVYDAAHTMTESEASLYDELRATYKNKIIIVYNKVDLVTHNHTLTDGIETINVSCVINTNIDALHTCIAQKITKILSNTTASYLLNERQYDALLAVETIICTIPPLLTPHPAYELVCVHVQDALSQLSTFSGKTISEQGLDLLFKKFCVGK
jgi:tRNA modification GTPase